MAGGPPPARNGGCQPVGLRSLATHSFDVRPSNAATKPIFGESQLRRFSTLSVDSSRPLRANRGHRVAALRKVSIRAHSWFNWLYPLPF